MHFVIICMQPTGHFGLRCKPRLDGAFLPMPRCKTPSKDAMEGRKKISKAKKGKVSSSCHVVEFNYLPAYCRRFEVLMVMMLLLLFLRSRVLIMLLTGTDRYA